MAISPAGGRDNIEPDFAEVADNEPDKAQGADNTGRGQWGGARSGSGRPRTKAKRMGGRRTWKSEVEAFIEKQLSEGAWSSYTAGERRQLLMRIAVDLKEAKVPPNPASITVTQIRQYIEWLGARSGRSGGTQRKALLLLSDFLKKQECNLAGEKMHRQFPPDDQPNTPRPPYEDLIKGFERLGAIEDTWTRTLARGQAAVFIGTLVRPSEGRRATYGDLDQKRWSLRIRHPKGKTREREVEFLDARCIQEMKQYLQERAETLRDFGYKPDDPSLPLFPAIIIGKARTSIIRIYSPQGFCKAWRRLFPGMDHYCARRGMAQYFVDKDISKLPAVSKVLGHASVTTTVKYYTEIRMDKACNELRGMLAPNIPVLGPENPHNPPQPPQRFKSVSTDPAYS